MGPIGIGALYGAGIAATPLLEYAWHAHVGHGRRPDRSRDLHLEHHRNAREVVAPWVEIRENAPRIGGFFVVLSVLVGIPAGFGASIPFAAGLVTGYVLVTLYHAEMHLRAPRSRWERWMWRFHWHHHAADARVNFGLTNPLFDFLFGTAVVPDVVEVHERIAPAWLRERGDSGGDGIRLRAQSGPSS